MCWLAVSLGVCAHAAGTGEAHLVRTNSVERWITNEIEVRMPINHFVNEYHTNLLNYYTTNVVTHQRTNLVWVNVTRTNWVTRLATNLVWMDLPLTNFVPAYRTNYKTLNVTNWTTVLVIKTNWVTQPITNYAEIELPRKETAAPAAVPSKPATEPRHARVEPSAALPPAVVTEALAIEADKGGPLLNNNQVEVKLTVRWTNGVASPLKIQQWKVEREDGSILCFGQDREFNRDLPVGKYRVEVRAQRDARGPMLAALGTLAVAPGDVVLQQKPVGSR